MSLYGVSDLGRLMFNGSTAGSGQSSGRGLMAVEDEEVNAEGSRQVYVPCIWKAVSIYFPHETKSEGPRSLVLYIG